MLIDEIKTRMTQAMRDRDDVVKNVLGLAFGEIQTAEARANRPLRDDEATGIVRRLLKSNEETLALASSGPQAPALRREIEVLAALLPRSLSVEQVVSALAPVSEGIRAAKSDGQAMGIAMKHLKASGDVVEAPDVQRAIQRVRSG